MNHYRNLVLNGEYHGEAPCYCEYQIGKCDKYHWIVVKQPVIEQPHQHITMRIEDLATVIFFKEIPAADPEAVRIIEYYPPNEFSGNIYPLGFAEQVIQRFYEEQGFFARLFRLKQRFVAFYETPHACKFPADDPKSFLLERGVII